MKVANNYSHPKSPPLIDHMKRKNSQFIQPATNLLISPHLNSSTSGKLQNLSQSNTLLLPPVASSNDVSSIFSKSNLNGQSQSIPHTQNNSKIISSNHKQNYQGRNGQMIGGGIGHGNKQSNLFSASLRKQFGSTSPIPRASCTSNNTSSSQLSYKKFVKQTAKQFKIAQIKLQQEQQKNNTQSSNQDPSTLNSINQLNPSSIQRIRSLSKQKNDQDSKLKQSIRTRGAFFSSCKQSISEDQSQLLLLKLSQNQEGEKYLFSSSEEKSRNEDASSIKIKTQQISLNNQGKVIGNALHKTITNNLKCNSTNGNKQSKNSLNKHTKLTSNGKGKNKQSQNKDQKQNQNKENIQKNSQQQLSEWKGFTHYFIAKKLSKAYEKNSKLKTSNPRVETKETMASSQNNLGSLGNITQLNNLIMNTSNAATTNIFTNKTSLETATTCQTTKQQQPMIRQINKQFKHLGSQQNNPKTCKNYQNFMLSDDFTVTKQIEDDDDDINDLTQKQEIIFEQDEGVSMQEGYFNQGEGIDQLISCRDFDHLNSSSFYNQSIIMDENSPHKNMKDFVGTISNTSQILPHHQNLQNQDDQASQLITGGSYFQQDKSQNSININHRAENQGHNNSRFGFVKSSRSMQKVQSQDQIPIFFNNFGFTCADKLPKQNDQQYSQNQNDQSSLLLLYKDELEAHLSQNQPLRLKLQTINPQQLNTFNYEKQNTLDINKEEKVCRNLESERQKLGITEQALDQAIQLALELYDEYQRIQRLKVELQVC